MEPDLTNNNKISKAVSQVFRGRYKMLWIMALTCLVPIAALFLLPVAGINTNWWYLVILICPVMHLLMMSGMHGNHDHGNHDKSSTKLED